MKAKHLKPLMIIGALLFVAMGRSQVGIGTPMPNGSAQLEVVSTDKGILIPMVAITSTTDNITIANGNVDGLTIFNTNTAADVTPGYYYWYNNTWNRMVSLDDVDSLGVPSDSGPPNDGVNDPTMPDAGDIYIDESTGDVHTYNGTTWVSQSGVSADADNALIEGTDGLPYLLLNLPSIDIDGDGTPDTNITLNDIINYLTENTVEGGSGPPNDGVNDPTMPDAGDIYIDESTGDVYTYNGTTWVSQSGVSADADNALVEGTDGLPYLLLNLPSIDIDGDGTPDTNITLNDIINYLADNSVTGGSGPPNDGVNDPTMPTAGDIYVDESTGDVYTYNGTTWVSQSGVSADANNALVEGTDGLPYLLLNIPDGTIDIDGDGTPDNNVTLNDIVNNLTTVVQGSETPLALTTDGNASGVTLSGTNDHTANIVLRSTDAGNILAPGSDGGLLLNQAAIESTQTPLALTTDGTVTGVALSGTADHTADITLLSGDGGNALGTGTDGGLFLSSAGTNTSTLSQTASTNDDTAVTATTARTIATHDPDGLGTLPAVTINETITTFVDNSDGTFTYTNEAGTDTDLDISQTGTGNPNTGGVTGTAGDVYIDESTGDVYTHNGTTWVQQTGSDTASEVAQTAATNDDAAVTATTARTIATHDDGAGTTTTINETITTFVDNSDGTFTYTNEAGTDTNLDISQTGTGNPNTGGVTGTAGDVYIDESTGDVYTHNGTTWVQQTGSDTASDVTQTATTNDDAAVTATTARTIAIHDDGDGNTTDINESITTLVQANGQYTYTNESDATVPVNITQTGTGSPIANSTTGIAGDVYADTATGDLWVHDGTNWVQQTGSDTASDITQTATTNDDAAVTATTARTIATHDDGAGNTTAINESITTLVQANGQYTYTNESDATVTVNITQTGAGDPNAGAGLPGIAGDVYADTATGDIWTHNGTNWVQQTGAGTIEGIDTTLAENESLTAFRTIDLNGNNLLIHDATSGVPAISEVEIRTINASLGGNPFGSALRINPNEATLGRIDTNDGIGANQSQGGVRAALINNGTHNLIGGQLFSNNGSVTTPTYASSYFTVFPDNRFTFSGEHNSGTPVVSLPPTDATLTTQQAMMVDPTTGDIRLMDPTDLTGGATGKIVLSAEYAGAALMGDGTDNVGNLTSDNAGAANSWMNFYEWSSSQTSIQDYDVIVRFTVPMDLNTWDATNAIVIDYVTENGATAQSNISAAVYLESSATAAATVAATASTTWTTVSIAGGSLATLTPGTTGVIVLKLASANNNFAQVGDITFNYTR